MPLGLAVCRIFRTNNRFQCSSEPHAAQPPDLRQWLLCAALCAWRLCELRNLSRRSCSCEHDAAANCKQNQPLGTRQSHHAPASHAHFRLAWHVPIMLAPRPPPQAGHATRASGIDAPMRVRTPSRWGFPGDAGTRGLWPAALGPLKGRGCTCLFVCSCYMIVCTLVLSSMEFIAGFRCPGDFN